MANGTASQLIRLTAYPGAGYWDGVSFQNTTQDNQLTYAIVEYGEGYYAAGGDNAMVAATNSKLLLDHDYFDHARYRRIRTIGSSLIVSNCTFTNIFGAAEAPLTNNHSEQIWGDDAPAGGYLIIENNTFGTTKGHNDIIDVNGGHAASGDPIVQILNNTFLGGGDEAMDIEGDYLVEGNVITHFHKDTYNTDAGESNAISAGDANDVGFNYLIARNVFYDVDHAVLIKDNSNLAFVNNTVSNVTATKPAIYFEVVGDSVSAGHSAVIESCIFDNVPIMFDLTVGNGEPTPTLTINRSIVSSAWMGYGVGNTTEAARLVNPASGNYALGPGSPALGTGQDGHDMGAMVAPWPWISGEPAAVTPSTTATLAISGASLLYAVTGNDAALAYKYRVNNGPWSAETPIATPVQLAGLANGTYTVYVIGKNIAGSWQSTTSPTASQTWVVNTSLRHVRINEVLAHNTAIDHEGTVPDMIELYNDGAAQINLEGMSLSDDPANPTKFVFPAGTTLGAGQYLVLYADSASTSGLHLGFALEGSDGGVYLYDSPANNQALLDSVQYGPQIANLSIGRIGHDGTWTLTQPTFGAANVAARTGDPATLKINEWLASEQVRTADDFIELYNPDPLPVPLSGLYLTNDPRMRRRRTRSAR